MAAADPAGLLGRTVAGKFAVEAVQGTGGMGTVYRARQLGLDRAVALKVLHQEIAHDTKFVERFKREAKAASRLDHPNSVRVLDFGEDQGSLYLAMEYVEGPTLLGLIEKEWPLDGARVARLLSQVLAALARAHELGVIHRDLKPDNIIVVRAVGDDGEAHETAKVCDFGIAQLAAAPLSQQAGGEGSGRVTDRGAVLGTPEYMSPEQARGLPLDARSDLYSLGAALYQALTRHVPFEGNVPFDIAFKHVTEPPRRPSSLAKVDTALETICLKALRKDPADRFQTAREMRAALLAAVRSLDPRASLDWVTPVPVLAGPAPMVTGAPTQGAAAPLGRSRKRAVLALATGTAAVLLGAAVAMRPSRQPAESSVAPAAPTATAPPRPTPAVAPPRPEPTAVAPPDPAAPENLPPAAAPSALPSPPTTSHPETRTSSPSKSAKSSRSDRSRKPARRSALRAHAGGSEEERPDAVATSRPAAVPQAPDQPAPSPPTAPVATPAAPAAPPALPAGAAQPPSAAVNKATAVSTPRAPGAAAPARRAEAVNVSIANITTSSGVAASSIRSALRHAPLLQCYRDAARRQASGARAGIAKLQLQIGVTGHVTAAVWQGAELLPGLKECVESAARSVRVRDVDTGDVAATVTLEFAAS